MNCNWVKCPKCHGGFTSTTFLKMSENKIRVEYECHDCNWGQNRTVKLGDGNE